jgi:DNA replication protein DnaC
MEPSASAHIRRLSPALPPHRHGPWLHGEFTTAMELLGALVKAQQLGSLEMRLALYAKPKLLIIDELGYLPLEPAAGHLFFQLISRSYEQGSVLISSNRPVDECGEVFGDQVVAAAILDRLLHHSHVVAIRGDSYRLREKRRSGLRVNSRVDPPAPMTDGNQRNPSRKP